MRARGWGRPSAAWWDTGILGAASSSYWWLLLHCQTSERGAGGGGRERSRETEIERQRWLRRLGWVDVAAELGGWSEGELGI